MIMWIVSNSTEVNSREDNSIIVYMTVINLTVTDSIKVYSTVIDSIVIFSSD